MSKEIIIRTPNYIGDTIMMLPALELVQQEYSDASITIVCKSTSKDIFRGKGIKEVIVDATKGRGRLLRTLQLIRLLRKNKYKLGILFHNSFLTALIFRLARIEQLIGYNKESRKFLLDFHLRYCNSWHYVNRYAHLVNQYFGNKYELLPKMELYAEASKLIKKKDKPLIGFVLGGDNKGARKYPKELAVQLFERLSEEDFTYILLGDNQDASNHQIYFNILKERKKDVIDLTGNTSVAEFIDAISTLDLLVTIDTSAMHIAAATNTEFILLQGKGTSPLSVVFPKDNKGHVLSKGQCCLKEEDIISAIRPMDIYTKIMVVLKKKVIFDNEYS